MPNNRNVGNQYERDVAKEFRELGFEECKTSRYSSKELDDAGVDLTNTGCFNVQLKRWKSAPSYHKVLAEMPDDSNYNVIMHKRPHKGEVVVMSKESFYEIIKMLKLEKIL